MREDKKDGWSEVIVSRPKSAKQARPSLLTKMFGLKFEPGKLGTGRGSVTYPFQIPMYNSMSMHIRQPRRDPRELQ